MKRINRVGAVMCFVPVLRMLSLLCFVALQGVAVSFAGLSYNELCVLIDSDDQVAFEEAVGELVKSASLPISSDGETLLHYAAVAGKSRPAEFLLGKGYLTEEQIQQKDKWGEGQTAAYRAAERGHAAVVQVIAQYGKLDLLEQNSEGRTIAHQAVIGGHGALVSDLVYSFGSNPGFPACFTSADNYGIPALQYLIVSAGVKNSLSMELMKHSHLECLAPIARAERVGTDEHGASQLHGVAANSDVKAVKAWFEGNKSADVNVKDNIGATPLFYAVYTGNEQVVRYLIEQCGADLSIRTTDGLGPAAWAINRDALLESGLRLEGLLRSKGVFEYILKRQEYGSTWWERLGRYITS